MRRIISEEERFGRDDEQEEEPPAPRIRSVVTRPSGGEIRGIGRVVREREPPARVPCGLTGCNRQVEVGQTCPCVRIRREARRITRDVLWEQRLREQRERAEEFRRHQDWLEREEREAARLEREAARLDIPERPLHPNLRQRGRLHPDRLLPDYQEALDAGVQAQRRRAARQRDTGRAPWENIPHEPEGLVNVCPLGRWEGQRRPDSLNYRPLAPDEVEVEGTRYVRVVNPRGGEDRRRVVHSTPLPTERRGEVEREVRANYREYQEFQRRLGALSPQRRFSPDPGQPGTSRQTERNVVYYDEERRSQYPRGGSVWGRQVFEEEGVEERQVRRTSRGFSPEDRRGFAPRGSRGFSPPPRR